MRLFSTFAVIVLAVSVASADLAHPAGCRAPADGSCASSAADQKEARKAFERGLKLGSKNRTREAFDEFERASRLVPENVEYATTREIVRQRFVYEALQRGNAYMLDHNEVQALAEFRSALEIDPKNEFALERMKDAVADRPTQPMPTVRLIASADDLQLRPQAGTADFQFRGDTRALIEKIAASFKVQASFDESFQPKQTRFEVQAVDFYRAMDIAGRLGKVFWSPISEKQFLVAADTPENRRRFERMSLRSFYITDATSPEQVNELLGMLRSMFDIRLISAQLSRSTVTVRAPRDVVDAATSFLEGFSGGPPQVMLDVKVYEINRQFVRDLGVNLPLQYTLINLSNVLSQLQNNPSVQQLINQLFANGGINQANFQAIQGLLAQLQSQQNSILRTPVATFGGGITLMGLAIPTSSIVAHFNESTVKTLQHLTMRAKQGNASNILVGTRYPILNASFSPIFNTPQIAQVIQNNSFLAPFPSFTYEDLGIIIKTTPQVHGTDDVTLKMQLQMRALEGASFNGVPVIANREYEGTINLKNGETALMAGYVTQSEQRGVTGPPGLGQLPVLRWLTSAEHKEKVSDELLILVTPHIIQASDREGLEVWMSK